MLLARPDFVVVLLGAIMFSAGARMRLYVQYYWYFHGQTVRDCVHDLVGIVFVLLTLTAM